MPHTFPLALQPLHEEMQDEVKKKFLAFQDECLYRVGDAGYLLAKQYKVFANKYYNFKFRPDDVVVMTFPKCGTTWMQEIVWTMRNNLNFHTAAKTLLLHRSPFLERDSLLPPHLITPEQEAQYEALYPGKDYKSEGLNLGFIEASPSPRTLKTHLPFSLLNPDLPNTSKVIYVARNPKDACVSYYYYQRLIKYYNYTGDFPTFMDFWCKDLILRGPFFPHVEEGWVKRNHPNVLFIFYEDLQKNTMKELKRINTFLKTELNEDQLRQVEAYTSFENMKKVTILTESKSFKDLRFNKNSGEFFRKGKVGGWTSCITPQLENKFDTWIKENNKLNIPFQYKYYS